MSARLDLDDWTAAIQLGAARGDGGSRRHDAKECDVVSRRSDAEDAVEDLNECDGMSRRLDAEDEELSSRRLKNAEFTEVERRGAADDVASWM